MSLHSDILWHIAAGGGGHVVLVTGAGCAMEPPTDLRSGKWYSEDANRRLVQDTLLTNGECPKPEDLSVLASTVFDRWGSQLELTRRLPQHDWRTATPNEGHFNAAALLIEGAVRAIITLNYDLAQQTALTMLGCPPSVAIVRGPEEQDRMGARGLVFIHRSVEADEETWVLRKEVLEDAWRDGWEEIVARGALAAPVTIFTGLGSPAAVLTETVKRLSATEGVSYFYSDPYPENDFVDAISDHLAEVYNFTWTELTRQLSQRVAEEQLTVMAAKAHDLALAAGKSPSLAKEAIDALRSLSLTQLGTTRASWLGLTNPYQPHQDGTEVRCIADLALFLGDIAKRLGATLSVDPHGLCTVSDGSGRAATFVAAHGSGVDTWSTLQVRLEQRHTSALSLDRARVAVVCGMAHDVTATPADVMRHSRSDDVIRGAGALTELGVQDLLGDPHDDADSLWERLAS